MARKIENRHEFETEEAAKEFAKEFREDWGLGYGGLTTITPPTTEGGKWVVHTTRYDSCD